MSHSIFHCIPALDIQHSRYIRVFSLVFCIPLYNLSLIFLYLFISLFFKMSVFTPYISHPTELPFSVQLKSVYVFFTNIDLFSKHTAYILLFFHPNIIMHIPYIHRYMIKLTPHIPSLYSQGPCKHKCTHIFSLPQNVIYRYYIKGRVGFVFIFTIYWSTPSSPLNPLMQDQQLPDIHLFYSHLYDIQS